MQRFKSILAGGAVSMTRVSQQTRSSGIVVREPAAASNAHEIQPDLAAVKGGGAVNVTGGIGEKSATIRAGVRGSSVLIARYTMRIVCGVPPRFWMR